MRQTIDDEMALTAIQRAAPGGWIDYDPVLHIRCYRTWARQVIPDTNWQFDLLCNWQLVRQHADLKQAVAFLEFNV